MAERARGDAHTYTYTSDRIGKKTPHGTIAICPKCGRRGARSGFRDRALASFTHAYRIMGGMRIAGIGDHCIVPTESEAK